MAKKLIKSFNPVDRSILGTVAIDSSPVITKKVENAKKAFMSWSKLSFAERAVYLNKLADLLDTNVNSLAMLITKEQGKPFFESAAEVVKSAMFLRYFGQKASEWLKPEIIEDTGDKQVKVIYEPIGVVAAIKPWNMPIQTPIGTIGPALAAGCTVLLKPSEYSLLVTQALEKLMMEALPKYVCQVVYGGKDVGTLLLKNDMDMVSFSGSVRTGRIIEKALAGRLIKKTLELGGKNPMIVLDDVDIDFAACGAVYGCITNCGQRCSSVEAIYVQESIYEKFVEKVVHHVSKLVVGNGLDEDVEVGPLCNKQQLCIVLDQITDAVAKGAKILVGAKTYADERAKGNFVQPGVLVNLTPDMKIMREETFGPLVCIVSFKSIEEVISKVNAVEYGLGASIFTQNEKRANEIGHQIDAGMIWINEPLLASASCPWIVRKASGIGYELGILGMREFTEAKLVSEQYSDNGKPRSWWYR
ncbi:MAG: aldehyde dehydrogenase family protein [Firmicutes bacterium]|nr:aldehyde dehydrogenase family protein [Bacillota bacterium]